MLMFLAVLSASVAASLIVEAADIEGLRARRRTKQHGNVKPGAGAAAAYPDGVAAGAAR